MAKNKNNARLRRLGVSDETISVNQRADESERGVNYTFERIGGVKSQLRLTSAVVMTLADTYALRRDHKEHRKAKALAASLKNS